MAAGVYDEDLDYRGKAIAVVGNGPDTIVRGTGTGPVVRFENGEGVGAVLDAVTVTGGVADRGGGIRVVGASPTIVRTVIAGNRAANQGSGVYLERSTAELYNNLIVHNGSAGGDPHSLEIQNASPVVINNTIARGDSNGIIVRGASAPLILNNVIAYNGAVIDGGRRGRGICDFSGGAATIAFNVFHRNRIAALLTDGRDFHRIRGAQRTIAPPRLEGNTDRRPFARRAAPSVIGPALVADFLPAPVDRSGAVDAGNPDPLWNDRDGSRNDAGFSGGPFARTRWAGTCECLSTQRRGDAEKRRAKVRSGSGWAAALRGRHVDAASPTHSSPSSLRPSAPLRLCVEKHHTRTPHPSPSRRAMITFMISLVPA